MFNYIYMKNSILVLFLSMFSWVLSAQNYYTVSVGTYLDAKSNDFENIKPLGFVYSFPLDGNLTHIYIGGYDNMEEAQSVADKLINKGYENAQVQQRNLEEGRSVIVIQMATRFINKNIEWEHFEQAGELYGILSGNKIKVVTGEFKSLDEAKRKLPSIRKMGYSDAFVKKVNSALLVKVGTFETGLKKPLIDLSSPIAEKDVTVKSGVTTTKKSPSTTKPTGPIVSYEAPSKPVFTAEKKSDYTEETTSGVEIPAIRSKVKRRSVLDLQKVLKAKGYYGSSLDGYYGNGTTAAYQEAMRKDRRIRKYQLLAKNAEEIDAEIETNRLQYAINHLHEDGTSPSVIDTYSDPIAKAYQAYYSFINFGSSNEVNRLMNDAIRTAYSGKKLKNKPPFDYSATYAYQGLDQLILHLLYVHAAPDNDYYVPCWLYNRHAQAVAKAQSSMSSYASNLKLQSCDGFLDWEEVRVLRLIAEDLAGETPSSKDLAADASHRAQLFLSPKVLSSSQQNQIEEWNTDLWSNINAWSNRDPLHKDLVDAFKIVYFQVDVLLEDHFMDQGFGANEAKGLALAALETLVGSYMDRFI